MTAAQRERAALVATMSEVGPDSPTLCEGWTARDDTRPHGSESVVGVSVLVSGVCTVIAPVRSERG